MLMPSAMTNPEVFQRVIRETGCTSRTEEESFHSFIRTKRRIMRRLGIMKNMYMLCAPCTSHIRRERKMSMWIFSCKLTLITLKCSKNSIGLRKVTYHMKQSPSWRTKRSVVGQVPRTIRCSTVHDTVDEDPPIALILSQPDEPSPLNPILFL